MMDPAIVAKRLNEHAAKLETILASKPKSVYRELAGIDFNLRKLKDVFEARPDLKQAYEQLKEQNKLDRDSPQGGMARLRNIKAMRDKGMDDVQIGSQLGLSKQRVHQIRNSRHYKALECK
jgi:hypothetical protein